MKKINLLFFISLSFYVMNLSYGKNESAYQEGKDFIKKNKQDPKDLKDYDVDINNINTSYYDEASNFIKQNNPSVKDLINVDINKVTDFGEPDTSNKDYFLDETQNDNGFLKNHGMNLFKKLRENILISPKNKIDLDITNPFISKNLRLKDNSYIDKNGEFCFGTTKTTTIKNEKSCNIESAKKLECVLKSNYKLEDNYSKSKSYKINNFKANGRFDVIYEFVAPSDIEILTMNIDYFFKYDYLFTRKMRDFLSSVIVHTREPFKIDIENQSYELKFGEFKFENKQYHYNHTLILKEAIHLKKGEVLKIKIDINDHYDNWMLRSENKYYSFYELLSQGFRHLYLKIDSYEKERKLYWERFCDGNKVDQLPMQYRLISNECVGYNPENSLCSSYREKYEDTNVINLNKQCLLLSNDNNCSKINEVCTSYDENKNCLNKKINYSCEESIENIGYQCGQSFYKNCDVEDCEDKKKNNAIDVITQLHVMTETAKETKKSLDNNDISIFQGKVAKCKNVILGYNNCCNDYGWGQDLLGAGCSSEEKELYKAKQRNVAISVGEYCSDKVWGVCVQHKKSYCIYPSKIARILHEQGRRNQLGIDFGDAENPNCRGLTVSELETLNFENMNFDELNKDFNFNPSFDSKEESINKIKNKFKELK